MYKILMPFTLKKDELDTIVGTMKLILFEFEHHLKKCDKKSAEYKTALQTLRGHNVLYGKFKACKKYHLDYKNVVKDLMDQFKHGGIQYPVSIVYMGTEYQYNVSSDYIFCEVKELSESDWFKILKQLREQNGMNNEVSLFPSMKYHFVPELIVRGPMMLRLFPTERIFLEKDGYDMQRLEYEQIKIREKYPFLREFDNAVGQNIPFVPSKTSNFKDSEELYNQDVIDRKAYQLRSYINENVQKGGYAPIQSAIMY